VIKAEFSASLLQSSVSHEPSVLLRSGCVKTSDNDGK